MKNLLLLFLLIPTLALAQAAPKDQMPVKKSSTGICHAPGSTYYNQTKNYQAFRTLDDCLKSGGRMPKR